MAMRCGLANPWQPIESPMLCQCTHLHADDPAAAKARAQFRGKEETHLARCHGQALALGGSASVSSAPASSPCCCCGCGCWMGSCTGSSPKARAANFGALACRCAICSESGRHAAERLTEPAVFTMSLPHDGGQRHAKSGVHSATATANHSQPQHGTFQRALYPY